MNNSTYYVLLTLKLWTEKTKDIFYKQYIFNTQEKANEFYKIYYQILVDQHYPFKWTCDIKSIDSLLYNPTKKDIIKLGE